MLVIPVSCLKATWPRVKELVEIHHLTEKNLSILHRDDELVASELFIFSPDTYHLNGQMADKSDTTDR